MVALQIRDIDDRVHDKLVAAAKRRGQSLQSYLHDVINDEARRLDNVAVIERFGRRRHGVSVSPEAVIETLHAERQARDAALDVPDEERR